MNHALKYSVSTTTLILLLLFLRTHLSAQEEGYYDLESGEQLETSAALARLPGTFDLFGPEEPLELKMYSDFRNLIRRKYKDEWQPAYLHLTTNGIRIVKKIRIKPRGNSRKDICYLPPIKLDFSKTDIFLESLKDLEKMKLVSYCKKGTSFQDLILKEYLAYRMYNQLTPCSFRVRLIRLTYVEGFSFLIEEIDRLATRNEAVEIETEGLATNSTNTQYADMVAVFNYMICNLDWSIPALHNIKLIKSTDPTQPRPIAVPYDFDYSGLVNAPYAIPPEQFGFNSIRQRKYWGFCRTAEELAPTVRLFREHEAVFLAMIRDFPYLSKTAKIDAVHFLDEFFRIISDDGLVKRYILEDCRTN